MRAIMVSAWPRLYLDTGDLNDIADGRADTTVVDRLTSVCAERGVLLVVSSSHFQDVLRVDQVTRDRFSTALERVQWRAAVMHGPEDLEIEAKQPVDIALVLAGNIRELTDASARASNFLRLKEVQGWLHEALAAAQLVRVKRGGQPLTQPAFILGWNVLLAIISGRNPTGNVATLFEVLRLEAGIEVATWERDAIIGEAGPFATLLARVEQLPDLPDDWRLTLLLNLRASLNPRSDTTTRGQYLSARLSGSFVQNIQRRPRPSDVVDFGHVSHLPYVDIATCDAASLEGVRRHLGRITCPRSVKLFRNSQLRAVVDAVEGLPNARQAMVDQAMAEHSQDEL
jgi:hypothetical protein